MTATIIQFPHRLPPHVEAFIERGIALAVDEVASTSLVLREMYRSWADAGVIPVSEYLDLFHDGRLPKGAA